MRNLKKMPERTCIGCNEVKAKNDLIRIVKTKENEVFVDKTSKASGRGAYICNNVECLEKAIKSKRLNKTFKMQIDNQIYEILRGEMLEE